VIWTCTGFEDSFRLAAYAHVRTLVDKVALPVSSDESSQSTLEEPPAKRSRLNESDDSLKFILRAQVKATAAAAAVSEFDRYLNVKPSGDCGDGSALSWWQQHAPLYPKCAHLARKYLAIPATSVQSERLFSATGRLITKQRTRLLADHADCLVFLNKNIDLF